MTSSIFKTGKTSSFAKVSRQMARILSLGSGALAVMFCLFIFYFFTQSTLFVKIISLLFPVIYLISFLLSYTKITNKMLYNTIFGIFLFTSLTFLYIAYLFNFDSKYIILMMAIFNVILFALPTTKQLLYYFVITFVSLEIILFMSKIPIGVTLLISLSFGVVFLLSYVISVQKKMLNFRSTQNAKILKTLVNNTKDVILLVDYFSKEISDANENSKELFALTDVDELISKQYYKIFADESFISSRTSKIEKEIAKNGYFQTDVMFKRIDGSQFLGRLHLSPFEALNKKYYLVQVKNTVLRKF